MVFSFGLKKYFSPNPEPFEELNIGIIFKPLYLLISVFGLFPYSIKFNTTKNQYVISSSSIYINSVCAVSVLLLMYTFVIAHIHYLYKASQHSTFTDAILTEINYVIELAALAVVCMVAYICTFLNRKRYVKIINAISAVFDELTNEKSQAEFSALRFQINVIVIGSIIVLIILQVCVNFTRADGIWTIVLVTFSFNLPHVVQIVYLYFYYSLIIMVVFVLRSLEDNMLRLTEKTPNIANVIKVQDKSCGSLRQLEHVYMRAIAIKKDINKAFQAAILMTTIQCLHSIVSEAYIIYHGAVSAKHSIHAIFNCAIWIGYQVLKIYILASSGNALKIETEKIGRTLHTIPTEKQDIRMLLEVQHFSSLMQHQDTGLTVYGYFSLDATLMTTMVATVTMYLIILVQFEKTSVSN